jgi:hypothetical protein
MFWPCDTGKKVPGKIIGLAVLMLAVAAPSAFARPKFRDKPLQARVRLAGSLGWVGYDDASRATNSRTQFVSAPQIGRHAELELWIRNRFGKWWPRLGLWGEVGSTTVKLFDRQIAYSSGAAGLAFRLTGTSGGGGWYKDEVLLFAGPNVALFPDARVYLKTTTFDFVQPRVLGLKSGLRYRHTFGHSQRWRMDSFAYYWPGIKTYNVGSAVMETANTFGLGGGAHLDYSLSEHLDLGVGLLYDLNRVSYRPIESSQPQSVQWINFAPVFSIQLWF